MSGTKMMNAAQELMLADITAPFSAARFSQARLPVLIGEATGEDVPLPSCLDMLIKLPGGEVSVPEPYRSSRLITSFLDLSLSHEDEMLPEWREQHHLYLTVDRRYVEGGKTHRNAGWHFDGMQGARYTEKLPACHQYVMSTANTTEFTSCPTDATGLDENIHDWFKELGAQVPDDAPVFRPRPREVMLMSAYQLHRSPVAQDPGWRLFVRLDVSHKQQDRLGNTVNPLLPPPWQFVERTPPEAVSRKRSSAGWEGAARMSGHVLKNG